MQVDGICRSSPCVALRSSVVLHNRNENHPARQPRSKATDSHPIAKDQPVTRVLVLRCHLLYSDAEHSIGLLRRAKVFCPDRIFRLLSSHGARELLGETPDGTTLTFDVNDSVPGQAYLVRAVKLMEGNGGKYWQMSAAAMSAEARILGVDAEYDFNADGLVNILDIDLIHAAIVNDPNPDLEVYDLDDNGVVDAEDGKYYVRMVLWIKFGDANLDFLFGTGDLVLVFQSNEFEDSEEDNSTWAEGDWNFAGDFTSGDLVLGYQNGYDE